MEAVDSAHLLLEAGGPDYIGGAGPPSEKFRCWPGEPDLKI